MSRDSGKHATLSHQLRFLETLRNRSMSFMEEADRQRRKRVALSEASVDMLPSHLGQGIDSYSRETKVPVIQLSLPTDLSGAQRIVSPRTGRSYVVPDRVNYAASTDSSPKMRAEVFYDTADYVAWARELRSSGDYIPATVLIKTLDDMAFLKKSYDGSLIAVTQLTMTQYSNSLDAPGGNFQTFALEENCAAALDYLPGQYDESSKELYKYFLDYWGDAFIVDASEGGMVESIHAVHRTVCNTIPYSRNPIEYLTERQRNFMGKYYGINGLPVSGSWTGSASYDENCATDAASCAGGDPVECANAVQAKKSLAPWSQTLWDLPAPVSVKTRPVTDMIREPAKKAAMQQAIDTRNAERLASFPSAGRDHSGAGHCPPEFPARPANWNPIFGTLHCVREGPECWKPYGKYVKLCYEIHIHAGGLVDIDMAICTLPDNSTTYLPLPYSYGK
jgi:hypothetical protein